MSQVIAFPLPGGPSLLLPGKEVLELPTPTADYSQTVTADSGHALADCLARQPSLVCTGKIASPIL